MRDQQQGCRVDNKSRQIIVNVTFFPLLPVDSSHSLAGAVIFPRGTVLQLITFILPFFFLHIFNVFLRALSGKEREKREMVGIYYIIWVAETLLDRPS
jgi:hypothetical protein